MMQVLSTLVFSGAAVAAGGTVWSSVAPQWRRIVRLASGHAEASFAPLSQLVRAEQRIAVRRRSAGSRPAMTLRTREAA